MPGVSHEIMVYESGGSQFAVEVHTKFTTNPQPL